MHYYYYYLGVAVHLGYKSGRRLLLTSKLSSLPCNTDQSLTL